MDNVEFEGDSFQRPKNTYQSNSAGNGSFLTRLAMKLGAKNETQAQMVLLCVAIVAIVLMTIVIITQFTGIGKKAAPIPPAVLEAMSSLNIK